MAMSVDEMKEWVEILKRQSGVFVDYTAQYDGTGTRDALEHIKACAARISEAARELQEFHA